MKYLLTCLLLLCTAQAQAQMDRLRAVIVEPGDSVLVQGLPGEGMRLRTAWSLNRSGNPIRGGWTAMDQYLTLQEQDQLNVGNYYLRSWSDTTAFVPSFIPFRPDTGRIPYRLPDNGWTVYIARVGPAPTDTAPPAPPAPPDTANLLDGLSWRHILYDAQGSFENFGDTLLRAYTYQVPGVWAHTPQIVASGWPAIEGDSMYAQFQVRGDIEGFRLDINTGPVGPESWAFHYTDTVPVSETWTWHTAAFEAQFTDEDNRFDFNLGIDTGRVEFRNVSLRRAYMPPPSTEVEQDSTPDVPPPPCPPADTVVLRDTVQLPAPPPEVIRDTVYLRDTVQLPPLPPEIIRDTVYVRDTVQLPAPPPEIIRDTVYLRDTLYLTPEVYLIQEVEGKEISRKKID